MLVFRRLFLSCVLVLISTAVSPLSAQVNSIRGPGSWVVDFPSVRWTPDVLGENGDV